MRDVIRVLLVDDEPLNQLRLRDLLRSEPDVEVVGAADDGVAAVEAIRRLAPDLVFLDVQMPGLSGLDVIREIGPARMPATIFVTAYDQYALQAFDAAAIDYLVKPYADERFEQAFRRARHLLTLAHVDDLRGRLLNVLEHTRASMGSYLERIAVEIGGEVRPIPVAEIDVITASGAYAELHAGGRRGHSCDSRRGSGWWSTS
jgi:two-component system, LytTR family, response regulator